MDKINITNYGFNDRFAALAGQYSTLTIGRVLSVAKGLYRVVSENGEQLAETTGKLKHEAQSAADLPAVGDFVMLSTTAGSERAIIHSVLPRKSAFVRKAAGTAHGEQVVAANIDKVFICMSLNNDLNLRRLERYLAVCWDSGATPVIVLTKADLCSNVDEVLAQTQAIALGADVLICTSAAHDGYAQVLQSIKPGQTVALIGSSGVGKSTLINHLLGEEKMATNALRNDDKGRHTTTRRELFLLPSGAMVIDTPGMREMQLHTAEISKTFEDIEAIALGCKFSDCSHKTEPGCAVRKAIDDKIIDVKRFESYEKLQREMSYASLNSRQLENEKINRMFGSKKDMKKFIKQFKDNN